MDLGAFSISLAVKDLTASVRFYETLGFRPIGGEGAQNWLILKNGNTVIGLFQGMFDENVLTFNPGWDQEGGETAEFTDIREIQKQLRDAGIRPDRPVDESSTGPASFVVSDPDGNAILIDQHR